jgi:hypothetical protein
MFHEYGFAVKLTELEQKVWIFIDYKQKSWTLKTVFWNYKSRA